MCGRAKEASTVQTSHQLASVQAIKYSRIRIYEHFDNGSADTQIPLLSEILDFSKLRHG